MRWKYGRHVKRVREWHQSAKQTIAYSHLVSRFPADIAPLWVAACSKVSKPLARAKVPTPVVPSADQRGAYLCLLYMQAVQLFQPDRILPSTGRCLTHYGVVDSTLAFGSIGHGFKSEHHLFSHHVHQPSASWDHWKSAHWTIHYVECCSSLS